MQVLTSFHSARTAVDFSAREGRPTEQPQKTLGATAAPAAQAMRLAVEPIEWRGGESAPDVHDLASSKTTMEYRRSERTALYIQTQEGDVVRLDFRTRDSVELDASWKQDAGVEATELRLETKSSAKLSIRVRGDLNAEELAAIRDTLEQASQLAHDFFAGDMNAAFESAAALNVDGDQLAEVKLRMKVKERLTYSSQGVHSLPVGFQGSAATAPTILAMPAGDTATAHAAIGPAAPPEAPVHGAAAASLAPVEEGFANEGSALDAPATADAPTQGAPTEPEAAQRFEAFRAIGDFLTRMMDTFGGNQPTAGDLQMSLKLRIFESTLVTMSRVEQADEESTLSPLVHDTIDALAASDIEPLNQVA